MNRLQIEDVIRIRLTLGLTQREFASKLEVSQGTIDSLENKRIQKLSKNLELKLMMLASKVQLIDKNIVEKEKQRLKTKGRFYGKRATDMAKIGGKKGVIASIKNRELTTQEKAISDILKLNSIKFELNAPILAKNRRFIVDFIIPNKENPKIFLEVKDWKGKWGKHLQCAELAWRVIKLKQNYPNSRFYVWISGSLIDSEKEIIEEETSTCFVNQPIENLIRCLRSF